MPRVVVTRAATVGIDRCRRFLSARDPGAARRASEVIGRSFWLLGGNPAVGRPFRGSAMLRELVIAFGDSGYVALYHHVERDDLVLILAFRHQREAGY